MRNAIALILGVTILGWSPQTIAQSQSQAVEQFGPLVVQEIVPRAGQYGITELMIAAQNGQIDVVKSLLAAGADANELDNWGSNALSWASYSGHSDIVELLISEGAELDLVSSRVTTAIGNAMMAKHSGIALILLQAGADPNIPRIYGDTLVEYAIRENMLELIEPLFLNGADIELQGPAALDEAIRKGDESLVSTLLAAGADPNASSRLGQMTPLFKAAQLGNPTIVNALLSHGAKPHERTGQGFPISAAANVGSVEIVDMLIASGAEVSYYDLQIGARSNNVALIDTILSGTDHDSIEYEEFEYLLSIAHGANNQAVIESLWRAGARGPSDDGSVSLIYRRHDDSNCNFFIWNPQTDSHRPIYESDSDCEGRFFVSNRNRTLINLRDDSLYILQLDSQESAKTVPLPMNLIDRQLEILKSKVSVNYQKHGDSMGAGMTAVPSAVGSVENGNIGLVVTSGGPADETYAFLFGLIGGEWVVLDEEYCERMASSCSFSQFEGRHITNWAPQRASWHANIRGNQYFVQINSVPSISDEGNLEEIQLNVDGQDLRLVYEAGWQGHCDGECLYTVGLQLRLENRDPIQLSTDQNLGHNAIANHYVLMRRLYRDNRYTTEVIDLRDGSSVLGLLGPASWIE